MNPAWSIFALAMLGLFALVFALASPKEEGAKRQTWLVTQAGAILMPFAFGIYLAGNASLGLSLYPLACLLVLLSAAAAWIRWPAAPPWRSVSAPLPAAWRCSPSRSSPGRSPPPTLGNRRSRPSLIALTFHLFAERDGRNGMEGTAPAASVSAVGLLAVLIVGALNGPGGPALAMDRRMARARRPLGSQRHLQRA